MQTLYCHECGAVNSNQASACFACAHPLSAYDNLSDLNILQTPLLHDRYRFLAQIGTGGFGAVYKAEDTQNSGHIVAIKVINLNGLTPSQIIEATDTFNREINFLSGLEHPHLPIMYEHFSDSHHWYLVMNFIDGETLEAYLSHKPRHGLALSETLDIGIQLCSVLDYLHTHQPPIIFRDVKPANIMRTRDGQLYLIDFGIARHFKPGRPKDTIALGSPGYAAPEQYGKKQTTPQSDIYSLGAVLYSLLTGLNPADASFQFIPLRLLDPSHPPELEILIAQMASLDPHERPASISAVKHQLQDIATFQTNALSRLSCHSPAHSSQPGHIFYTPPSSQQVLISQSIMPVTHARIVNLSHLFRKIGGSGTFLSKLLGAIVRSLVLMLAMLLVAAILLIIFFAFFLFIGEISHIPF